MGAVVGQMQIPLDCMTLDFVYFFNLDNWKRGQSPARKATESAFERNDDDADELLRLGAP